MFPNNNFFKTATALGGLLAHCPDGPPVADALQVTHRSEALGGAAGPRVEDAEYPIVPELEDVHKNIVPCPCAGPVLNVGHRACKSSLVLTDAVASYTYLNCAGEDLTVETAQVVLLLWCVYKFAFIYCEQKIGYNGVRELLQAGFSTLNSKCCGDKQFVTKYSNVLIALPDDIIDMCEESMRDIWNLLKHLLFSKNETFKQIFADIENEASELNTYLRTKFNLELASVEGHVIGMVLGVLFAWIYEFFVLHPDILHDAVQNTTNHTDLFNESAKVMSGASMATQPTHNQVVYNYLCAMVLARHALLYFGIVGKNLLTSPVCDTIKVYLPGTVLTVVATMYVPKTLQLPSAVVSAFLLLPPLMGRLLNRLLGDSWFPKGVNRGHKGSIDTLITTANTFGAVGEEFSLPYAEKSELETCRGFSKYKCVLACKHFSRGFAECCQMFGNSQTEGSEPVACKSLHSMPSAYGTQGRIK